MSWEAKATNHFGFNKLFFAFENFSLGFLINEVSSSRWWYFLCGRKRNIQQIQKLTFFGAGTCLWILKGHVNHMAKSRSQENF